MLKQSHSKTTYSIPGNAHELTFSTLGRRPLLNSDRVKKWFLENLDTARSRWNFHVWAYVLMPEHVHLLIWPQSESYSISKILIGIKKPVAYRAISYLRETNPEKLHALKVEEASGKNSYHLWQPGGGYDRNICVESTVWASIDYIHNNPVRRGLSESPDGYAWSSSAQYMD